MRFMKIGNHYVNLDKINNIEVYRAFGDHTIVNLEYDHASFEVPCSGSEVEVRNAIEWGLQQATDHKVSYGPDSP